ncbi:MAG: hypothetical protein Q7T26_04950 [Dehalococcoidia bacterium]|nr:hypothetical protein [Dehalococcoidia bacterium]
MQAPDNAACPVCARALVSVATVTNRHETGAPRTLAMLRCGTCARHFLWERVDAIGNGAHPAPEALLGPVAAVKVQDSLRLMRACPAPEQAACVCQAHPFLHEMCGRLDNVWATKRQR